MSKIINLKIGIAGIVVLILVVGFYVGSAFYIKTYGIELEASRDFDYSEEVEYFLQNDERWGSDNLGDSPYTVAQQGCTMTAVAMVLDYLGESLDPGSLNKELRDIGAYTDNGSLLWYKLEEIYPVEYKFKRIFSSRTIENDLEHGNLPIVRVAYSDRGFEHWVLIVGARDGGFLVMDPLESEKTLTDLGDYGNIYAYRLIKFKK